MLAIKLRPIGKKKQRSFRVVIAEKRSKLKGKFIEDLGWYNPHTDLFSLRADRVKFWVASGAQPTDTVHNILISAKILEGAKIPVHKKSKEKEGKESVSKPQSAPPSSEEKEGVKEIQEVEPKVE